VTQQFKQIISQWVLSNLDQVSVQKPSSVHIDTLLGSELPAEELLPLSLQLFTDLIDIIKQMGITFQPGIVIPLIDGSQELEASVPLSFDELEKQLHELERPSLYLIDRETWKYVQVFEEYKYPICFDLLKLETDDIYVYYREFRSMMAIENNWEFTRCIYADYYPEIYRYSVK
jgi:hypothetical protein